MRGRDWNYRRDYDGGIVEIGGIKMAGSGQFFFRNEKNCGMWNVPVFQSKRLWTGIFYSCQYPILWLFFGSKFGCPLVVFGLSCQEGKMSLMFQFWFGTNHLIYKWKNLFVYLTVIFSLSEFNSNFFYCIARKN